MHSLLVVDDEFNIRNGLVTSVPWETIGVRVVGQAQDGREALELAKTLAPDLVVTDISMDEMDGLDFTAALLELRPRTKVIILSGYGEFAYAQRALSLRVSAYLLKPIDPDDLLAQVAEAVKELEAERDLARRLGEPSGDESLGRAVIRRAREFLESRFADHETSLEALADHLGLTPGYLSKLFKAETGRNYSEELAHLRIEKAKELLLHSNLKLAEVGTRVGHPNPQYFATVFRRATGMSPSEFRERLT